MRRVPTTRTFVVIIAAGFIALGAATAGASWNRSVGRTPPLVGQGVSGSALGLVSCVAASTCEAVGPYLWDGARPTAMAYEAGHWSRGVQLVLPPDLYGSPSHASELNGLSCWAANGCAAVGDYVSQARPTQPFAVVERAGVWQRATSPVLPLGAPRLNQHAEFDAVWCGPSAKCIALGGYTFNSQLGVTAMTSRFNGSQWTRASRIPAPRSGPTVGRLGGYFVSGLWCSDVDNCVATLQDESKAVVLNESGGVWALSRQLLPPRGSHLVDLNGVSCISPGNCLAVGENGVRPVWTVETAGTWGPFNLSVIPSLTPRVQRGGFAAVSCTKSGPCVVLGQFSTRVGSSVTGMQPTLTTWSVSGFGPTVPIDPSSAGVRSNRSDFTRCFPASSSRRCARSPRK